MTVQQATTRQVFAELHSEFGAHGPSERADVLCAELAAQVTAEPHPVCVGIFGKGELRKVYGLVYTLSKYGLTLRSKRRPDGNTLVFAEIELPTAVQFTGAFVRARQVRAKAAA